MLKEIENLKACIKAKKEEIDVLKTEINKGKQKVEKAEPSLQILKTRNLKKKMSAKNLPLKKKLQRTEENRREKTNPVKQPMKLPVPAPPQPSPDVLPMSIEQFIDSKSLNF